MTIESVRFWIPWTGKNRDACESSFYDMRPFHTYGCLWLPPQFNSLVESRHMQGGIQECYLEIFCAITVSAKLFVPQGRGEGRGGFTRWELLHSLMCVCVCVCVTLSTEPLWASTLSFKTGNTVFTSWSASGNPQIHSEKDFNTILAIIVATVIRGTMCFPSQLIRC